jgi:hypothetical protein
VAEGGSIVACCKSFEIDPLICYQCRICARIFGDAVFLGETLDLTGTSQRSTCTHA